MQAIKKILILFAMIFFGFWVVIFGVTGAQELLKDDKKQSPIVEDKPKKLFDAPDKPTWSEIEVKQVALALKHFSNQCAPLSEYWEDVDSATVSIREAFSLSMESKGWERYVYAEVKLKEKQNVIPKSYRAWGHTCHYELGIEGEIGMFVAKSPCQKLCAMTPSEMSDGYVKLGKTVAFENTPEELRIKKVKQQFSSWDGSHRNLERLLKSRLNDPDSYEHDKTVYWDKTDYLVVSMSYRAKNAFGALVKGHVKAKTSLDGQVLEIVDSY